jgi:hypothetical protein
MNRALAVFTSLVLALEGLSSQPLPVRSWIYFSDKPSTESGRSPEGLAAEYGISARALRRRAKVLPPDRLIDAYDQPVSDAHISRIESMGLRVNSVSKWLNAVSVTATPEQLKDVAVLPFVSGVGRVGKLAHPPAVMQPAILFSSLEKASQSGLNYGLSYTQLANIRVTNVHDLGIDGSGVIVGMIDNGFNNHRSHNALKNITVLDEYDFIHDISSTQRQPWESAGQGNHGAATLSALAGFADGILIGPAYGASLILAKTEMDSTEVPAEEDLYVEALEWMETLGADIVSTSLGYVDWYPYDSLNGTTAITTKAARIAASKGVLLVTAMGNEGWFRGPGLTGTMIAPADADSIIAVGASHSDYEVAAFSSTGPTADGRIKPDIMAQGVGVIAANGGGTTEYISAQGTSLSTPLVAGAAALLLSSRPELTPMQVREAILQTAYRFADPFNSSRTATYPNNYYGQGILDAYKALLYHGIAIGSKPRVIATDTVSTSVYISIASNALLAADSLSLMYQVIGSAPFQRIPLTPTPVTNLYRGMIPAELDSMWRGYVSARDQDGRTRLAPYNAPDSLFVFSEYVVSDIPGITPQEFHLLPNYPNPFNAGTTISFDAPGVQSVELLIFDLLGRRIKTLYEGNSFAGRNVFHWDGTDDGGRSVSTGVYISRLRSGTTLRSQKILLLR